jgi:beta-galactosidase
MRLARLAVLTLPLLAAIHSPDCLAETLLRVDATGAVAAPTSGYLHLGTTSSPDGHSIGINNRYLLRDGQPWLPVMGEFHYTRVPAQYWDEELAKMQAAGVDIVSAYVIWQHHEERDGQFDWSGDRDVRHFVELCAKHKLYVFLRLGPWVHAEVRYGGIPDWVVAAMPTRSSDPTYLSYVGRFYEHIGEQVKGRLWKDGGPVIGIQIENEYNRTGAHEGRAHITDLKQLALKAGFDVPLYTVTAWDNTVYPAHEVTPVFGSYPDAPWAVSPGKSPPNEAYAFRFQSRVTGDVSAKSLAATAAGDADADRDNTPFLSAEYAGGLPSMYRRRTVVTADDIASLLTIQIGSGVNLYGYYMFHGGRNPAGLPTREENTGIGGYNDLPAMGYDFQAPIGEYGQMHPLLGHLRPMHYFLSSFGAELAPMVARQPELLPKGVDDFTTPRFAVRSLDERGFLFVSNHVRLYPMAAQSAVRFAVRLPNETITLPSKPVDIPTDSYFVWPLNMDLAGVRLVYATAQPITHIATDQGALYVFRAVAGMPTELALDGKTVSSVQLGAGASQHSAADGRIVITGIRPGTQPAVTVRTHNGSSVRMLVLSEAQAERLWVLPVRGQTRLILSDAQLFLDGDSLQLRSHGDPHMQLAVYPALGSGVHSSLPLRSHAADGLFEVLDVTAPAAPMTTVGVTRLREAQTMPPIAIGGPAQAALQPYPETFGKSAAWTLTVPRSSLQGVNDAYLQIHYAGDVARLFSGTELIDDAYYNGLSWEIGLKRYAALLDKPFTLTLLPLRQDAPIYLEPDAVPKMSVGSQIAELGSVEVIPEYALQLR